MADAGDQKVFASDKPTKQQLITIKKKDGTRLRIIDKFAAYKMFQLEDFANMLLGEDGKEKITALKRNNTEELFIREVLDYWLSLDDDKPGYLCTWEALAKCVSDAGLDGGAFAKAIRGTYYPDTDVASKSKSSGPTAGSSQSSGGTTQKSLSATGSTPSVQPSPPQPSDNDPSTDLSTDPSADSSTHSSAGSSVAALTADVVGDLQDLDSDFPDMMTDMRKDLVCSNPRSSSSPQPGDTDKKEEFLRATTINMFQQAEMRAVTPIEKSTIIIIPFTMKDVRELGKKASILTCIVLIIAAAVRYHHSCVEQLQEELQIANKLLAPQESELKEVKRRVRDLQKFVLSSSLVQVTGEGKELATAGKETCFELSLSSQTPSSHALTFLFKHLSCQLTDPHHQHIHCSITSTQPGVCTVKYTPTVRGPHQLGITIRDTEITGSPFTIYVLPSPEMRGEVQLNIPAVQRPWGVAVSKSGEVVVSDYLKHSISVYSREGNKIRSFGSTGSSTGQFQYPRSVAITFDNHILVADTFKHRIQMFTMEGKFVKSVGQKGQEPLQFKYPSGIAVHPSGTVFVTESMSHRIQVLNSDLSYSHMFGSEGSAPGQLSYPRDVAINSSGVVYVTDHNNHRVQLFYANGQFISSLGSEGSQHGQFYNPTGICIDSTNTVYITDFNHRVSVYTSNGQFIKSFSTLGSGKGELSYPEGVAVDGTTGALYVCDHYNDRVVVY